MLWVFIMESLIQMRVFGNGMQEDWRLDLYIRLLRDTDMYLYEIAERMGYRDVKYFSMLFKEAHHMTPKSYRQKYREEDDHVPAESE